MVELQKSHWETDNNHVYLNVPISKVDRENRLVSGFATLDNVDTSDDVVTAEASKAAFEAFRGNIREMHQPIAAGRLVDFKEDEFFYDGKFYRGIYATAYVSKGAEDTWEKVVDGTLSGFSIGGNITDQETKYVADEGEDGKVIRFIKGYDLIELSLVDNPANQLANVFSIVKSADGTMMKGMIADTTVVNVFWCSEDEIAKNSTDESATCLSCGKAMTQIGWFEQAEGEDSAVKTAAAVSDFLRQKEVKADSTTENGEGGVEMKKNKTDNVENSETEASEDVAKAVATEEDVVKSEEVVEEDVVDEAASEEVTEEEPVEASAEVVDEAPAEPDFEKMFDDLKDSVMGSMEATVEKVEARVAEITQAFDEKASEFEKSLSELSESLEEIREKRDDVEKRLDDLEGSSAVRKSGESEGEPVKKERKGLWHGTFFDAE